MKLLGISSIILAVAILAHVVALGQVNEGQAPGFLPYTPTRLEWLATDLRARGRRASTPDSKFEMDFVMTGVDTISIMVWYSPDVNRVAMNKFIDQQRKVINIEAKSHGWDSWLKVKEEIQMER